MNIRNASGFGYDKVIPAMMKEQVMKRSVVFGVMWITMIAILCVGEIWAENGTAMEIEENKRLTASVEEIDLCLGGKNCETVTLGVKGIEANRRNFNISLVGDTKKIVEIELLGKTATIRGKKPGSGYIRIGYWGLKETKDIPVTVRE